jgi:hypothetical protein
MVAVAAVAVEAVGVGVMVILTMGLVVVTTATVAGEGVDGNCSLMDPFFRVAPYDWCALARSADLMPIARLLLISLRPEIVAVSVRVQ